MSIIKNTYPILEYDSDENAVIMPCHEKLNLKLPKKLIFAFLDDTVDKFAKKCHAKIVAHFISITKKYPIYTFKFKNEDICLVQAPVGASSSTQLLDWLIGYGCRQIIATGSCGVLSDIDENKVLMPLCALRDEGTSYHYMPPARFVNLNKSAIFAIKESLENNGVEFKECVTWTTDGFYRETKSMVDYRKEEGCNVVEMECSALACCAERRGAIFGEILFSADSLANLNSHNSRNWGVDSHNIVLDLCLDAVLNI